MYVPDDIDVNGMTMEYGGIDGVMVERKRCKSDELFRKGKEMKKEGKERLSRIRRGSIESGREVSMDYEANKYEEAIEKGGRKGRDEEGRRMGFASGEDGGVKLLPRSREDDVKARIAMARVEIREDMTA